MSSVSAFTVIHQGILNTNSIYTDPSLDWDSAIPWLRSQTKLQLWLKGVLSADDVALAIKYGLDGVVVSNHGGRQLDGVPATLFPLRWTAVFVEDQTSSKLSRLVHRMYLLDASPYGVWL